MSKYVARRKDVCAGELLKICEMSINVYDGNNKVSEKQLEEQGINLSVSGGLICRGMLFNVNEDGLANDLIYTTPTNYPIRDKEPKINVKTRFIIDRYVELEEVLKYLKYAVDLTQNDLYQIYRKFIIHKSWLKNHIELFGFKKLDNGMGYCSGGTEKIPMEIYNNLSGISGFEIGRPCCEEPGYRLIKRRK